MVQSVGMRVAQHDLTVRTAQPLQKGRTVLSNLGKRRHSAQANRLAKRVEGPLDNNEDEHSGNPGTVALSVIDAGGDGEQILATATPITQGASELSIKLGPHVTSFIELDTSAIQIQRPASAATSTVSVAGALQAGVKVDIKDSNNVAWPIAIAIIFAVLVLMYTIAVSRSLFHAISSGLFRKGWCFRSSRPEILLNQASYASPINRVSKLRAKSRGFYNRFLLPTLPLIDLTIGQCAILIIYFACIITAVFARSGGPDSDVSTSARIAVAQFPFIFALATKNSLLGITGKSYEKLNFLHRFAGRSSLICGLMHSIFYLRKWNDSSLYDTGDTSLQMTGVVAMITTIITLFTSLRCIRNAAYQFFMASHIIGWITLLIAVYLHVPYAKPWVIASLVIIGLDFIARLCKMRLSTATLHAQEGGVVRVELDNIKSGWNTGQHVWIRRLTAKSLHETHPFAISNSAEYAPLVKYHLGEASPSDGMVLYSKCVGKWTRNLHQASLPKNMTSINADPFNDDRGEKQSVELEQGRKIKMLVDGPYGVHFFSWGDFETVILIAGGGGITYILGALEDIVARSMQAKSSTRRVKIIFIVRNTASIESFIHTLEDVLRSASRVAQFLDISVEVYETRSFGGSITSSAATTPGLTLFTPTSATTPGLSLLTPGLAMTPGLRSPLVKGEIHSTDIRIIRGQRPNLTTCLNHALNDTQPESRNETGGGVALISCGPMQLITSVRRAAKEADQSLAYRAGGIVVHSEKFGW